MLNPPFVHDLALVQTGAREHAVAAALGDGRLYWYWPTAAAVASGQPSAQWVESAHASAISSVVAEAGAGARPLLLASGGNDGLVKLWNLRDYAGQEGEGARAEGAVPLAPLRALATKSKVETLAWSRPHGSLYIGDQTAAIKCIATGA